MFKLLPAFKAGGWLITPRLLIGHVRENSQNGALQASASHLGKLLFRIGAGTRPKVMKSVFRFVRVGAIRTFKKNDDWCNVGFENPDQYGGESSHASAPIYFIMERTWKGFPAAR